MGKSLTPKYRLEYYDSTQSGMKMIVWSVKDYGNTTEKNIGIFVHKLIESLKTGGCNDHLSKVLGFIPIPYKAQIVNQFSGEIVAVWNAPMFMEI
jgi:hypothetical protein